MCIRDRPDRAVETGIQDRVYAQVQGEVEALTDKLDATKQAIFVMDWTYVGLDAMNKTHFPPGTPPVVIIESREKLASMLELGSALRDAPVGAILVVVAAGESVGIRLMHRISGSLFKAEHFKQDPRDPEGYMVSPTGMLLVLYHSDLDDYREGSAREKVRRFQEQARGLLAAEIMRVNPRPLDVLLFEEFKGSEIQAALNRGEIDRACQMPFQARAVN